MKKILSLLVVSFALFSGKNLLAQDLKKIEILNSEALRMYENNGKKANMLVGHVKLRQDSAVLECDSALFYTTANAVDAFGHVHITQGDSLDIHSDSLKYDGDKKIANFYGHVKMRQGTMRLSTPILIYDMQNKIATYFNGGHLINDNTDLVSEKGYYYTETKMSYFKKDVVLKTKEYTLTSDTLSYNTKTGVSTFFGPTNIITDTSNIYCESGTFNTKTNVAYFGAKTVLDNKTQKLTTDSLYHDRVTGLGKAYKKFSWFDSSMNMIIDGRRADFQQKENHITATNHAMLTYVMDSDTLFLTADTLISLMGPDSIRYLFAFHHVKIFKKDLQGLCDSMFFSFKDSVMWMYRNPVLWNEVNQLTGDTITMTMHNKKIDHVELFRNGYIINQSDSGLYNQIKGKHITGYFEESKLKRMFAKGNGESLYYGKDDSNAYIGINKAVCGNIWIYLDKDQISRVVFLTQPDASFTPIQKANISEQKLKGFNWRIDERPKSKEDIKVKDGDIISQYLQLLLLMGM